MRRASISWRSLVPETDAAASMHFADQSCCALQDTPIELEVDARSACLLRGQY